MVRTKFLLALGAITLALACGAQKGDGLGIDDDDDDGAGAAGGRGGAGNGAGAGNGTGDAGVGVSFPDALNGPPQQTPGTGGICGRKTYGLQKQPAELLLVLDRSGSMLEPVVAGMRNAPTKWTETVGALDTVIKTTEATVHWGLKLFPGRGSTCGVPAGVEVPVALNAHTSVTTTYAATAPQRGGGTPTTAAMAGALEWLRARSTSNPKYIALATDGLPTCRNGDGSARGADDEAAVMAIAAAAGEGIRTFVIGIALGPDADNTLNRMADAGGTARMAPQRYYPVASREELANALGMITGQIASCTFTLDMPPPEPTNVAVDLDGQRVPRSATDGWEYGSGNRSIVLLGSWCDKLKNGEAQDAQITFGCPGEVIP